MKPFAFGAPPTLPGDDTPLTRSLKFIYDALHQIDLRSREASVELEEFQPLADNLSSITDLTDPGADRIAFWDDSASKWEWLVPSTHLSISGTNLAVTTGASGAVIGLLNAAWTRSGLTVNTAQPAFSAYVSSTVSNVTGDGTSYTLIPDTEDFDQASNYNAATGVFTAPVDGRYALFAWLFLSGVLAGHTAFAISIVTSNRSFTICPGDLAPDANTRVSMVLSVLAGMDANDTAKVNLNVDGSTKVVDVIGSSSSLNGFAGFLAC